MLCIHHLHCKVNPLEHRAAPPLILISLQWSDSGRRRKGEMDRQLQAHLLKIIKIILYASEVQNHQGPFPKNWQGCKGMHSKSTLAGCIPLAHHPQCGGGPYPWPCICHTAAAPAAGGSPPHTTAAEQAPGWQPGLQHCYAVHAVCVSVTYNLPLPSLSISKTILDGINHPCMTMYWDG